MGTDAENSINNIQKMMQVYGHGNTTSSDGMWGRFSLLASQVYYGPGSAENKQRYSKRIRLVSRLPKNLRYWILSRYALKLGLIK